MAKKALVRLPVRKVGRKGPVPGTLLLSVHLAMMLVKLQGSI